MTFIAITTRNCAGVWLLLVILVTTGCSALGPQRPGPLTPVVPPGLGGRLAYTLDGGLWTLDLRDGRAVQVRPPPGVGQIQWARWSPDGQQLAYGTFEVRDGRTPVSEVFVTAADGSNPRKIVGGDPGDFFQAPVWAPDGQALYVIHTVQRPGERARTIERVEIATGAQQVISDEFGFGLRRFDVSSDGRWLAMAAGVNTGVGLLLVDVTSGEKRWLVAEGEFDEVESPRFDRTSQQVLFAAGNVGAAPRGELPFGVAVAYAHGTPLALYAVPVAGGPPRRLTPTELDDPVGVWSPDGAHLAILSTEALAILPLGGGTARTVLTPSGSGSVDWTKS